MSSWLGNKNANISRVPQIAQPLRSADPFSLLGAAPLLGGRISAGCRVGVVVVRPYSVDRKPK